MTNAEHQAITACRWAATAMDAAAESLRRLTGRNTLKRAREIEGAARMSRAWAYEIQAEAQRRGAGVRS